MRQRVFADSCAGDCRAAVRAVRVLGDTRVMLAGRGFRFPRRCAPLCRPEVGVPSRSPRFVRDQRSRPSGRLGSGFPSLALSGERVLFSRDRFVRVTGSGAPRKRRARAGRSRYRCCQVWFGGLLWLLLLTPPRLQLTTAAVQSPYRRVCRRTEALSSNATRKSVPPCPAMSVTSNCTHSWHVVRDSTNARRTLHARSWIVVEELGVCGPLASRTWYVSAEA